MKKRNRSERARYSTQQKAERETASSSSNHETRTNNSLEKKRKENEKTMKNHPLTSHPPVHPSVAQTIKISKKQKTPSMYTPTHTYKACYIFPAYKDPSARSSWTDKTDKTDKTLICWGFRFTGSPRSANGTRKEGKKERKKAFSSLCCACILITDY